MKIIFLAVLCFCAVNAEADYIRESLGKDWDLKFDLKALESGPDGLLEDIRTWIESFIQHATTALNAIVEKFREIVAKVKATLEEVIEKSKAKLEELLQKLKSILEDLAQQNAKSRECVEKYRPKFESILSEARAAMEDCMTNAIEQLQTIRGDIQDQIDTIRKEINDLREIFGTCLNGNNPISAYLCMLQKSKEIIETVTSILGNVKQSVELASKDSLAIISAAGTCMSDIVVNTQSELNGILAEVRNCIQSTNDHQDILMIH